ncbi:MAG: hypothetical protein LBL77_02975 [Endomicrobium sp.]|jgi:hypothetical protein|nr:hypothetical protein [Endomicrobium sp.]
MKRLYKGFLIIEYVVLSIIFIFCARISLYSQEVVGVLLNADETFVGDIINFKVKVKLPENARISAEQNFHFNDFDILNSSVERVSYNENIYELSFKLITYKTGFLTINPITIFYINSDGTNDLFFTPEEHVEIKSIIRDDKSEDIKDIKPLNKLKIKPIYIFLMIIIFAFFVICVLCSVKAALEYAKRSQEIKIDFKTKILDDLNDLYVNKDSISVRNFYYKMFEILRIYISKQYKFDALEMTTSEFFRSVKQLLPNEIPINEFKDYLKMFNLARYADFTPDVVEIENNYNFTKKLLELL